MDNVLFLMIIFLVKVNAQTISTPPADVTTRVGEDASLTCRVTGGEPDDLNTLEWREYVSASTGRLIYKSNYGVVDPDDAERYEVLGTGGNYDLRVKNPQLTDGGFYGCYLSLDTGAPPRGDLVVLDQPSLTHTDLIEGKYNLMKCYAYYGAPTHTDIAEGQRAKLRMRIEYDSGDLVVEGNFTEVTLGVPGPEEDYLPWEVEYDVNRTFTNSDHGVNITCELYTDGPQYSHSVSEELDVLYPVRNMEIAPRNTYYYVGEYINCTAEGNPNPTVKWEAISSAGARPVVDGYLEISYQMQGPNTWRCNAVNTVEGSETLSEDFTFDVVAPTPESASLVTSQWTVILIALAIMSS